MGLGSRYGASQQKEVISEPTPIRHGEGVRCWLVGSKRIHSRLIIGDGHSQTLFWRIHFTTMQLSTDEILELYQFCQQLGRSAGAIILRGSKAILEQKGKLDHGVNEKKNAVDLVTEWDVRVEEYVKEKIRESYPGFSFIGEESYSAGEQNPVTDTPTFCVDPIDGTTNFVHGFPYACISIGFRIVNSSMECLFQYHGLKGHGSYLVSPLHPTPLRLPISTPGPLRSLSEAQVAVEWGSDRSKQIIEAKSRSYARLAGDGSNKGNVEGGRMVHSLRSLGSAALNFANVASGGLDIYWYDPLSPILRICAEYKTGKSVVGTLLNPNAGVVIAQEAGSLVAGSSGALLTGAVDENTLTGRKYIVIRCLMLTCTMTIKEESGLDAQKRLIKEFYDTVEDWAPN
ncbi:myo inositol monophosphatase [Rhizoctonia solani AG-1 IA]|uniref:Myo inositol monophosphatase n=1 Tax=Thanatephorus cucumeris (strain AG1-IA) TaxID=983506 RepID=L8WXQ7_THACA|nr:myo inositol monophosphatase [Rhizoctonia solani AG-1 IA]